MKTQLAILVGSNLALRTAWVLAVHPQPQSDFGFYFGAATRMAAGAGYTMNGEPTAYWPIGWPGFLSLAFRALGPHLWVALAVQILITTAIAAGVYLIARRMTGSGTVGLVGALAWTLLPDQLAWTSILGSEPLYALLLLCGLYALVALEGWQRPAIAGLALGAACVVRPTILLAPAVMVVILVIHRGRIRAALAEGALLLLVMLVVVAPLTIRNAAVLGTPVLVSTNGGVNLWQGVHADDHYWWPTDPEVNPLAAIDDEVARDRMGQRLFLEHLATNPAGVAGHAMLKILALLRSPGHRLVVGRRRPAEGLAAGRAGPVRHPLLALPGVGRHWPHDRLAPVALGHTGPRRILGLSHGDLRPVPRVGPLPLSADAGVRGVGRDRVGRAGEAAAGRRPAIGAERITPRVIRARARGSAAGRPR